MKAKQLRKLRNVSIAFFCTCALGALWGASTESWQRAYAQSASTRQWWVYMTPDEARKLYASSDFAAIKSEADNSYLNGLTSASSCLVSDRAFVNEAGKSLDVLSATYLALKWGQYNGAENSVIANYRNRIVTNWKAVMAAGPASRWTDSFGPSGGSTCVNNVGWHEGDIALRSWIYGALPSYDAIRDDISSTDRAAIDGWMREIAGKMWADTDYVITHNRGISRYAQAHVMALVLQDRNLVNTYFDDSTRGLNKTLAIHNYQPSSSCGLPYRRGLSHEHSYKTGPYGRNAMNHAFHALGNLARASRTGGETRWDINKTSEQTGLSDMLNTWYAYGTTSRSDYVAYSQCLENNWYGYTQTDNNSLNVDLWGSFAFLQSRFLSLDFWNTDAFQKSSGVVKIWRFRGGSLAGTTSVDTTPPYTNLISNSSFDAENFDTQTPSSWSEWSDLGGVSASFTESTGGSNSGMRHGTHWMRNNAYRIYTYQTKTDLANGLYTLRAKAKRGSGQTTCVLEVKDYGGSTRSAPIPQSSTYQTVEIKDINVSNRRCTVGFWTVGNAGNWSYFDDVELFKQ